jgi:hypothetical protein
MRPTSRAFLNDYVIDQVAVGWSAMTGRMVKALAVCKKQKAKLVIAKLDRLSRNLAFIATLMDSGVEFVAVDNPHANKLTFPVGTPQDLWRATAWRRIRVGTQRFVPDVPRARRLISDTFWTFSHINL